jgi:ABC-type antimicrobial peptide transport system permease subunit
MALGARREDVFRLVLKKGLLLAAIGIGVGFFGFIVIGRAMSGLIYGLSLMDPATYGEVSLLLVVVTLLACFVPALRATRVVPMVALRAE